MLLDELKIEQDDLKVGDVVYTSHHSTDHPETNKNRNGLWRIYES